MPTIQVQTLEMDTSERDDIDRLRNHHLSDAIKNNTDDRVQRVFEVLTKSSRVMVNPSPEATTPLTTTTTHITSPPTDDHDAPNPPPPYPSECPPAPLHRVWYLPYLVAPLGAHSPNRLVPHSAWHFRPNARLSRFLRCLIRVQQPIHT